MTKKIIKPTDSIQGSRESQTGEIKKHFWPIILTTITSSQEEKEKLESRPVYIIYRDNSLNSTLVPKIVENLKQIGKNVIVHSFPAGTPEEEIKKYFEDKNVQDSLKNAELLNDYTCYDNLPGGYKFYSENDTKESLGVLDDLSRKIMQKSLLGKDLEEKDSSKITVSSELNVLQNIMKGIIEKKGEPEQLYIVENRISDHGFKNSLFRWTKNNILQKKFDEKYGKEYKKMMDEGKTIEAIDMSKQEKINILNSLSLQELKEMIEENDIFKQSIDLGFDKDKLFGLIESILKDKTTEEDWIKVWNNFIANKIKDSLKNVIDKEKIKIVADAYAVKQGDENYVLIDWHASFNYNTQKPILSHKMQIPVDVQSTINYITTNQLLDINFDVDEAIKAKIEEAFKE